MPTLLFAETIENNSNQGSIGTCEIRFRKPIILGQIVFHVNGQNVIEMDNIEGANTQNITNLFKKRVSLTTEDTIIKNIQIFAKNLSHPADKFEKLLVIPSAQLMKDGKSLRMPIILVKDKADYDAAARDACQELLLAEGMSLTKENVETAFKQFQELPSVQRLKMINEQKFLTNYVFLRGIYEKLTISIYGWIPEKDVQNRALENEFEINVNHLQIHTNYRNAYDFTSKLNIETLQKKMSAEDITKEEELYVNRELEDWIDTEIENIQNKTYQQNISKEKNVSVPINQTPDSKPPTDFNETITKTEDANLEHLTLSNPSKITLIGDVELDANISLEKKDVQVNDDAMNDDRTKDEEHIESIKDKDNESVQHNNDRESNEEIKLEENKDGNIQPNKEEQNTHENNVMNDNEMNDDIESQHNQTTKTNLTQSQHLNTQQFKKIDLDADNQQQEELENQQQESNIFSSEYFLFEYKNLDPDSFNQTMNDFEKLLNQVYGLIRNNKKEQVNHLTLLMHELKEKTEFMHEFIFKHDRLMTNHLQLYFNSHESKNFIFSSNGKRNLRSILKYGLEGVIGSHMERLRVLEICTLCIMIDPTLKEQFDESSIIYRLLWVINEEIYEQSIDVVYYYAAKLLIMTYSLQTNKIIFELNLVEYSDSKRFQYFKPQNFVFIDEYHSDRKSFFDNVDYNYHFEKIVSESKLRNESKNEFLKYENPKYTYLMTNGVELLMSKYTKNNVSDKTLRKLNALFTLNKICHEANKIKKYSQKINQSVVPELHMQQLIKYLNKTIESMECIFRNFEVIYTDLRNFKKESKFKYIYQLIYILINEFKIFEYIYLVQSVSALISHNYEWQYMLNFFAHLNRIDYIPAYSCITSNIIEKISLKSSHGICQVVKRLDSVVKCHNNIRKTLKDTINMIDLMDLRESILCEKISNNYKKIYIQTVWILAETHLSSFQANLVKFEYLQYMIKVNYIHVLYFWSKLEAFSAEDLVTEVNVSKYNFLVKLQQEVKSFDKSTDMNARVKHLIKEYFTLLNSVLKTHEPTKEIKTYESFLFTSNHVKDFMQILVGEKKILFIKIATNDILINIKSYIDMECLWYNNFIRYINIFFCITVKSLEHAFFSFKSDEYLANKFDYWHNIIIELFDISKLLLDVIEAFCNCIAYTDFNEIVSYFDDILIKSLFNFYGLLHYLKNVVYVDPELFASIECNLVKIFIKPKFMEYYIAWMLEFCYLCSDQYTQVRQYLFVKVFTLTFRKNIMFIFENKLPELSADKLYHKEMIPIYKILDRTTGVFKNIFDIVYNTRFPLCRIANCNMFQIVCFESNFNHNMFIYNFLTDKLKSLEKDKDKQETTRETDFRLQYSDLVLYYLASVIRLPQVKCIFISKKFIIDQRILLWDMSKYFVNVFYILEILRGLLDETVYLSWYDNKEEVTKKIGKYLDKNSIIMIIDLFVNIYNKFTDIDFNKLADDYDNLARRIEFDRVTALEEAEEYYKKNCFRREDQLRERRAAQVNKYKLAKQKRDEEIRQVQQREKERIEQELIEIQKQNEFEKELEQENEMKDEKDVEIVRDAEDKEEKSDKESLPEQKNDATTRNDAKDPETLSEHSGITDPQQKIESFKHDLTNNVIEMQDSSNSTVTEALEEDVVEEELNYEEKAEKEITFTPEEILEEEQEKYKINSLKNMDIKKVVEVTRLYIKHKYEYYFKVLMKFIEIYTLLFNSKHGILCLVLIKKAYNMPSIREMYDRIYKLLKIFRFQVGIEFVDSFVRLITVVSEKLNHYDSFGAYEHIFRENINESIDTICNTILSTLELVNSSSKMDGFINYFNKFKTNFSQNYDTEEPKMFIEKMKENETIGIIDDLKVAIESYFEFKNSNKTEDLRLNNNQYFLSTFCKKNLIDDLNDIQAFRYDSMVVDEILAYEQKKDSMDTIFYRMYSKPTGKRYVDGFHLNMFEPHPSKYDYITLSDEEVKNKNVEEGDFHNETLLNFTHFEKITMALVDETQLSSLKEKRKNMEDDTKITGSSREQSTHVDNFMGTGALNILNQVKDSNSESVTASRDGSVTQKIIQSEKEAKQSAMAALQKLFNKDLTTSNEESMNNNQIKKDNEIYFINNVPENLKSSNETVDRQLSYNKGLTRQANHTLQKFSTYGVNNFVKPENKNPTDKQSNLMGMFTQQPQPGPKKTEDRLNMIKNILKAKK